VDAISGEENEIIAARLRTDNTTQRLFIPSPHMLLRWRRLRRAAGADAVFYEGMCEKRLVTISQEIVDACQLGQIKRQDGAVTENARANKVIG
jgi:hypothetical protein